MSDQKPRDVLQPVDERARRLAKEIVRTARYAAIGTVDAASGAPSVSRVAIATFSNGDPGFFISALAAHYQNLVNDARCSLLVGEPGKGDPLAYPRMTLIGAAERLQPGSDRDGFRARYRERNAKSRLYEDLPDFSYWRFRPHRLFLNAGFGKAFALAPGDLAIPRDRCESWDAAEPGVIAHMNDHHAASIEIYARKAGSDGSDWRLACVDPEGLDLVRNDEVRRLWFDRPLQSVSELRACLVDLARR